MRSSSSCRTRDYGPITTEILPAPEFYYAEDYHQQYLAKNPDGYCGLGGTGVSCPVGTGVESRGYTAASCFSRRRLYRSAFRAALRGAPRGGSDRGARRGQDDASPAGAHRRRDR